MKTSELAELVGKSGRITELGLRIEVRVLNGKTSYGNSRLLITPVAGSGEAWVSADRVTITNEPQ